MILAPKGAKNKFIIFRPFGLKSTYNMILVPKGAKILNFMIFMLKSCYYMILAPKGAK